MTKDRRDGIIVLAGVVLIALIAFMVPQYQAAMHGSADDRVAFYTELLALATVILAAFSASQIWFLISADKTAKATADAADKSATAAAKSADAAIRSADAATLTTSYAEKQIAISAEQTDIISKQHEIARIQVDISSKEATIAHQNYLQSFRPKLRVRNIVIKGDVFVPNKPVNGQFYVDNIGVLIFTEN